MSLPLFHQCLHYCLRQQQQPLERSATLPQRLYWLALLQRLRLAALLQRVPFAVLLQQPHWAALLQQVPSAALPTVLHFAALLLLQCQLSSQTGFARHCRWRLYSLHLRPALQRWCHGKAPPPLHPLGVLAQA